MKEKIVLPGATNSFPNAGATTVPDPAQPELTKVLKALRFAAVKHAKQRRKGADDTPYINHPIEVAEILSSVAGVRDENVLAAALLHDTVEDTDTTEDELESLFGERVASLVMECTDDKSLSSQVRKQLQVDHAADKSAEAKLIKIADKLSNVNDIAGSPPKNWSRQRCIEYLDWSERVVRGLRGACPSLDQSYDAALKRAREEVSRQDAQS